MYRPNSMYRTGLDTPDIRSLCLRINQKSVIGNLIKPQQINYEHWCETCDRGFKTKTILQHHKKQHQKCNIDGCQFVAHPKVILKHVQMQHSTGLYKKIAKLNNPDEIAKWREDRKKRYPTQANIEKKKSEIKEKIERGETMGLRTGGRKRISDTQLKQKKSYELNRKQGMVNMNSLKMKMSASNRQMKGKHDQKPSNKPCKVVSIPAESRKLRPFAGIEEMIIHNDENEPVMETCATLIEDDEFTLESKTDTSTTTPVFCGALTSLINDYGSSDEEESLDSSCLMQINNKNTSKVITAEVNKDSQTKATVTDQNVTVNNDDQDDDSGPEEVKIVKQVDTNNSGKVINSMPTKLIKRAKAKQVSKKIVRKTYKRKLPSTLLEKLLSNEIRKERNIVLQCIRHIVKNDFFTKT